MKKILYLILISLLITTAYFKFQEKAQGDFNVYAINSYYSYIYESNPLYDVIREWDEAFSLDGNLCKNPTKQKQLILQRGIERRRK